MVSKCRQAFDGTNGQQVCDTPLVRCTLALGERLHMFTIEQTY